MKTHFYTEDIINICDNRHLTVDEIFEKISQIHKSAWKSSIYRNVEELVMKWKLKKITWIWKKTYFEKAKEPHIHLIDEESWNIVDVDINDIPDLNLPKNFKINNIDIKVFGKFM